MVGEGPTKKGGMGGKAPSLGCFCAYIGRCGKGKEDGRTGT